MRQVLVLVFLLFPAIAWGQEQATSQCPDVEIRLTSAPGAPDLLSMLAREETIQNDTREMRKCFSGIKFYQAQLLDNPDPGALQLIKSNYYLNLVQVDAFRTIKNRFASGVSAEIAAIKPPTCFKLSSDIDGAVNATMEAVRNTVRAGGRPEYLDIDTATQLCGYDGFHSGELVARFLRQLRDRLLTEGFTGVKFGSIEPYPALSLYEHMRYIDKIYFDNKTRGYPYLYEYYLDVDLTRVLNPAQLQLDFATRAEYCRLRSIRIGLIINGEDAKTPAQDGELYYFDTANKKLALYQQLGLFKRPFMYEEPVLLMFQSWARDSSGKSTTVPVNVPDTQSFTHTNFVLHGVRCILGLEDCAVYPAPPGR